MPKQERISVTEAARNLGLTTRAVAMWGNRPGAPVAQEGGRRVYLWPAFPRWRDAELRARAMRLLPAREFQEARTRRLVALAGRAEHRLEGLRRRLVTAEDAEPRVRAVLVRVRGAFARWPALMAPRLVRVGTAGEARVILEAGVVELLTAISGGQSSRPGRP